MEIIVLENVTFTYPGADKPALRNISLSVNASEFVVVCGASGCGKTTLARTLKREIAPHGALSGRVAYKGQPIGALSARQSAGEIGFVMQSPENQIVTDTVWHEMAFGLENLGLPGPVIRRRVAETAHYFGIGEWFEKLVFALSGGQKQILNLAAVMVMQPQVLILDEPMAQLDPIAAKEFLAALARIHRELGTTVIITEHRLEEIFPIADRVLYMREGRAEFFGSTGDFIQSVARQPDHAFYRALPIASQIALGLGEKERHPVTVRDGRVWLKQFVEQSPEAGCSADVPEETPAGPALAAKDIWFRYSPHDPFVLRGFSLCIPAGKITAIVGGNASGKTTALSVLAGINRPARGSVRRGDARIALLPQNPKTMFVCDTVGDDLHETAGSGPEADARIEAVSRRLGIHELMDRHPYDVSGGEQQKVAIAKLLLTGPEVLLLDEPVKGLDVGAREELAQILKAHCAAGGTAALVTHDLEFAARYADLCAMMFNGEIVCAQPAKAFFIGNTFYTTTANRIARDIVPDAVTYEDVIKACNKA